MDLTSTLQDSTRRQDTRIPIPPRLSILTKPRDYRSTSVGGREGTEGNLQNCVPPLYEEKDNHQKKKEKQGSPVYVKIDYIFGRSIPWKGL